MKVYVKFERQKLKARGHFGETFTERTTEKIKIKVVAWIGSGDWLPSMK
jgi:hypothetical protein